MDKESVSIIQAHVFIRKYSRSYREGPVLIGCTFYGRNSGSFVQKP